MKPLKTTLLTATLATTLTLLSGCWQPGGSFGLFNESDTIESRVDWPTTVSVIDRRDGSVIWTYDVPVGSQLSYRMVKNAAADADPAYPDLMKWDIWEMPTQFGTTSNVVAVPDRYSRMVEIKLRKAPELPEVMKPMGKMPSATVPATLPAPAAKKTDPNTMPPMPPTAVPSAPAPRPAPVEPSEPARPTDSFCE